MDLNANKHRKRDYTQQIHPRRHITSSLPAPMPTSHSESAVRPNSDEEYRVSININLPDYNQWRITKFARQYPYLSIGLAIIGLLVFALFVEGAVALWHNLTLHPVKAALMFMPGVL